MWTENPCLNIKNGGTTFSISVNSSGMLSITPGSKTKWKSYSQGLSDGEVYVDSDGFLKIKNW